MDETLVCRTRQALIRHLEDINDQIDSDGGRIRDPELLDGIKDCVCVLDWLSGMDPAGRSHGAKS